MVNALVFGTGGVGAIYCYILEKAGAKVTACCRGNYDEVKENGLAIDSKIFGKVTARPTVVRSVQDAEESYDFILVCSKANPGASPSTATLLRSAVSPHTAILLMQNGIAIEGEFAQAFPRNAILSGVIYLPVTQTKPGVISHGNLEKLEIGTYPANAGEMAQSKAKAFAELFVKAGATCIICPDIQEQRWSKLMVNASWNPICALSMCSDADFLRSSDEATDMVMRVMMEIVAIAQKKGYTEITEDTARWQLSRAQARLRGSAVEPSMLTDVRFGRPMELEAIVGNAVREARKVGVPTPTLEMLYVIAKARNVPLQRGRSV